MRKLSLRLAVDASPRIHVYDADSNLSIVQTDRLRQKSGPVAGRMPNGVYCIHLYVGRLRVVTSHRGGQRRSHVEQVNVIGFAHSTLFVPVATG